MTWLEGIPGAFAVLGVGIAAVGVALLTARLLGLDRALLGLSTSKRPGPESQVGILCELADLAHREGVLSLEARIADLNDDFLASGVAMAVDGARPDEIRTAMEARIDIANACVTPGRRLLLTLARYPQVGPLLGAAALLLVMVLFGAGPTLAAAAVTGLGLFGAGIVISAVVGPLADRLAGHQAALVMVRLLQIEAIASIRTGCDGRALQPRLLALLPGSKGAAQPLSRAA